MKLKKIIKNAEAKALSFTVMFLLVAVTFSALFVVLPPENIIVSAATTEDWNRTNWNCSGFPALDVVSPVVSEQNTEYIVAHNNTNLFVINRTTGVEEHNFTKTANITAVGWTAFDESYIYYGGRMSGSYPLGSRIIKADISDGSYVDEYANATWYYPYGLTLSGTTLWTGGCGTSGKNAGMIRINATTMTEEAAVDSYSFASAPGDNYFFDFYLNETEDVLYVLSGMAGIEIDVVRIYADTLTKYDDDVVDVSSLTYSRQGCLLPDDVFVMFGTSGTDSYLGWNIYNKNLNLQHEWAFTNASIDNGDQSAYGCPVNDTHFAYGLANGTTYVVNASSGENVTTYTAFDDVAGGGNGIGVCMASLGDGYVYIYGDYNGEGVIRNVTLGEYTAPESGSEETASITITGLDANDRVTFGAGVAADVLWSNATGNWGSGAMMNITIDANATHYFDEISINLNNSDLLSDEIHWENVSCEVSVDNSSWDGTCYDFSSGVNLSLNASWSNGYCHGANPFPITNSTVGVDDYILVRFKLAVPATTATTGTHTTDEWLAPYNLIS